VEWCGKEVEEGWEVRREEGGEIQEEITSSALRLIREWFADLSPAHQFALKMVLVFFDSNKRTWTGPSQIMPAELGQTQTAGLGYWAPWVQWGYPILGTQQTLLVSF
jgi:hypothetical protein